MIKKVAILGSTGSIGKTLINILKKDKKKYNILLLTANKNINVLLKQIKLFKVKNIIVSDLDKFNKIRIILKNVVLVELKKLVIVYIYSNAKY